nr:hypothetical protein [Neorhizobium tomejilense]
MIAAIVSFLIVYKTAERAAYRFIIAEMERSKIERCLRESASNCLNDSNIYVTCPVPVPQDALQFWWNHRGEANLREAIQVQYANLNYDFDRLKQWCACTGLLIQRKFNSINVSSPAKYGFTIFGASIIGITHGSTLEIRPSAERNLQVRVGFTYL